MKLQMAGFGWCQGAGSRPLTADHLLPCLEQPQCRLHPASTCRREYCEGSLSLCRLFHLLQQQQVLLLGLVVLFSALQVLIYQHPAGHAFPSASSTAPVLHPAPAAEGLLLLLGPSLRHWRRAHPSPDSVEASEAPRLWDCLAEHRARASTYPPGGRQQARPCSGPEPAD